MSFFRSIWKGSSKHKKLYDEWALAIPHENENEEHTEETTFTLKYLGSTLVEIAASEAATADAVKAILNLTKAAGRKTSRVTLSVSERGIRVVNPSSNDSQLDVSIYRISYCSADATHSNVFAFIATNADETLECHAFLCPKRKVAQTISLTVAQMFNSAFQEWQISQEQLALSQGRVLGKSSHKVEAEKTTATRRIVDQTPVPLIDFDVSSTSHTHAWVNFDNDNAPSGPDYNFCTSYLENVTNGNVGSFPKNVNIWDQSSRNVLCS